MRKKQIKISPGEIYGAIKIIDIDKTAPPRPKIWRCECLKCGAVFPSTGQDVFKYQQSGCPDCRKKQRNRKREEEARSHIGEVYGQLEIIGFAGMQERNDKTTPVMICLCHKCMKKTEIPLTRLRAGQAKECVNCARANLKQGHGDVREDVVDGTMVTAIDGRRQKNKNNTSGHIGVSLNSQTGKWRAYINFRRKQYHLGLYDSIDDAISARKAAEKEIYGNFLEWYAESYPEEWAKLQARKV